jgi:hypothetical protein
MRLKYWIRNNSKDLEKNLLEKGLTKNILLEKGSIEADLTKNNDKITSKILFLKKYFLVQPFSKRLFF